MADVASVRIPKKRNKEGITKADVNNRDIQNLLADVNKKCLDIHFHKEITVLEVYMLHNSELQAAYVKKRTEMKEEGRNSQTLVDQLGFLHFHPSQRSVIDRNGLHTRYLPYNRLGKSQLGVYLNRYFDVEVKQAPVKAGEDMEIAVVKYFAGKCKSMNIGNLYAKTSTVEPTPNFDSHISAAGPGVDEGTFLQKAKADIYLYEYDEECEPVKRPRQCLPHAIIKVRLKPLPEKITPAPPPTISQNAGPRSTPENSTPGAAPVAASPSKQGVGEGKTRYPPLNALEELPSPFLKDSKRKAAAKERHKAPVKKDIKQPKTSVMDEKKKEEMRNSYLHRLSLAKATVEATQSKVLSGLDGLTSLLQGEGGPPQIPHVLHRDSSIPEAVNMSQRVVPDQGMFHKPVSSAKTSTLPSDIQEEMTLSAVNPGLSKRLDPRLARSTINAATAMPGPRLDPRLGRVSTVIEQPVDASWELPGKPETAPSVHKAPLASSKGALKPNSEIKKMSFSEYKILKKDDLSRTCPEKLPPEIKTKPKDTNKAMPPSTVLAMPISLVDSKKPPPKPSIPDKQIEPADNTMVPLPSFYQEYTPDEEYPCQDVDFNQFQSPVKASSSASSSQYQSPIPKPVRNSPSHSHSKKSGVSKKSLLPLPVFNSDGSISNVLRGIVDGAITEIKTPPQASQPPQKAVPKLLIKPELINNMAKNLARTVASMTGAALQDKNMSNNNNNNNNKVHNEDNSRIPIDHQQNSSAETGKETQNSSKSLVREKAVKGLLKGFHKGLLAKSDSSPQLMNLVKETQIVSQNGPENMQTAATSDKEVPRMRTKDVCRQTEKSTLVGVTETKNRPKKPVDQKDRGISHKNHPRVKGKDTGRSDVSKEKKKIREVKSNRNHKKESSYHQTENDAEKQRHINTKLVCSPPPLPLIPFLVTDNSKAGERLPVETVTHQQNIPEVMDRLGHTAAMPQALESTDIADPLDSGMWVAPAMDELSSALDFSPTPNVPAGGEELKEQEDSQGGRGSPTVFCSSSSTSLSLSDATHGGNSDYVGPETKSLTMRELGFNYILQVMTDLAYQPDTKLVDCLQAVSEDNRVVSCQECNQLLPPGDRQFVRNFLDSQNTEQSEESDEELQGEIASAENIEILSGSSLHASKFQGMIKVTDTSDLTTLHTKAATTGLSNTVVLDKVAERNVTSSTECLGSAVRETRILLPSTYHRDAGNSKPGLDSFELEAGQTIPATSNSVVASSSNSSAHTYPDAPTSSTKLDSKSQAILPCGEEKKPSVPKVSQSPQVLKPLDKMFNSHSYMEIQSERNSHNTLEQKTGLASSNTIENSPTETGYWRTSDQNCPLGTDMSNASLQKEQRKTILLQVLKQKEKIKRSFEKHSLVEKAKLEAHVKLVEELDSKARDEPTQLPSEGTQKQCNEIVSSNHEDFLEDENKRENGSDEHRKDYTIPMSCETVQNEQRSDHVPDQVSLSVQEIQKGDQEVMEEPKTCEHTSTILNQLDMLLNPNKYESKEISSLTCEKINKYEKTSEHHQVQRDPKHVDHGKEKRMKDEIKERCKTLSGNERKSHKRYRNKSGSRERETYREDRKRREKTYRHREESRHRSGSRERDRYRQDRKDREKRYRDKEESEKHKETISDRTKENSKLKFKEDKGNNERQPDGDFSPHKTKQTEPFSLQESLDKVNKAEVFENRHMNVKEYPDHKEKPEIPSSTNLTPSEQKSFVSTVHPDDLSAKVGEKDISEDKDENPQIAESLSQNDQNSKHVVQPNVKDSLKLPNSNVLSCTSSSSIETGKSFDIEIKSKSSHKQINSSQSAGSSQSSQESVVAYGDSDEEFGAPKKIIQPVKKKIFINLPGSSQAVKTKVPSASLNEIKLENSTPATVTTQSPVVSLSLTSISSCEDLTGNDLSKTSISADSEMEAFSNTSIPATDTGDSEVKPILSVEIAESNSGIEELYSPSYPTIEDQASFDNTFEDSLKSSADNSVVESNQLIPGSKSNEPADVSGVQIASKDNSNVARYLANQAPAHRNVFSLYPDSERTSSDFYSFENNDFGDVDYRQVNPPSISVPQIEKTYGNYRMDDFSLRQDECPSYGKTVSRGNVSQWGQDYYDYPPQDIYPPFNVPRPQPPAEAGYWQGYEAANSNDYGDTDYRQQPETVPFYRGQLENSPQVKSETDGGISSGSWTAPYNDYSHQTSYHDTHWSHNGDIAHSHGPRAQTVPPAASNTNNSDGSWSHSQPTTHLPANIPPLDELYRHSDSSGDMKQPLDSLQKTVKPVSETEAALHTILPEMFSHKGPTHKQKCKNILKAFSQTKTETDDRAFQHLAVGEDESDDGDDAVRPQESGRPGVSGEDLTPNTAFHGERTGELSSVDRLKEILATVKRNARISREVKETQASNSSSNVQPTGQGQRSENRGQMHPSTLTFEKDKKETNHPGLVTEKITPLARADLGPLCTELSLSSTSNLMDKLIHKISGEGISLQNSTTIDMLKTVLNDLTEKIHETTSENDTRIRSRSEESAEVKSKSSPFSLDPQMDSEGKRPPVVSLSKVFQSCDMGQDSDDDTIAEANKLRYQQAQSTEWGKDREEGNGSFSSPSKPHTSESRKNLMFLEPENSSSSMRCESASLISKASEDIDKGAEGISHDKHQEQKSEKDILKVTVDNKNSRTVRKGEAGGLCIKVSNSSLDDHSPKSEETRRTEVKSSDCQGSLDSRVVVVESSLSAGESPVVSASNSNLSINVRNDGKVYLSDVSMDVLAFARDKILDQINELIDDAEDDRSGRPGDDTITEVEEEPATRGEDARSTKDDSQTNGGEEMSETAKVSTESEELDNDTEDGEIKDVDVDDGLSDVTVCGDEGDLNDVENSNEQPEISLPDVIRTKKNLSDVIEVSSESDTGQDIEDQPTDNKTTRGVFCRKSFGPLRLSPSYIENCKKKLRKKRSKRKSKSYEWEHLEDSAHHSDVSETSNLPRDVDNLLRHPVTSPLNLQPQISSPGSSLVSSKKKTFSFGDARETLNDKRKKRRHSGLLLSVEKSPVVEKAATSVEHNGDLQVAKADSSSDWTKNLTSSSPKLQVIRRLERQVRGLSKEADRSGISGSEISPLKVSSSVSDRKVVLDYENLTSDLDSSPEKKVSSKVSSVICRPEKVDNHKGKANKFPPRSFSGRNTEQDQSKKVDSIYLVSGKTKVNRSTSRDHSTSTGSSKRSVSPCSQPKSSRRISPKSSRARRVRASRSSSRGRDRRGRSSSSEYRNRRSESPKRLGTNRGRRSRSSSREYKKRRNSRSSSLSPCRNTNERGRRSLSRDSKTKRYVRDSPARNRKRANSPRRCLSRSPLGDEAITNHRSYTHSPSSRKRFNNELDYYTSRQPYREKSPVWKDLPSFSGDNSTKQPLQGETTKGVDYLSLDYFTTKKRRIEVASSSADNRRDTRVVKLNTPDREPSEFEELMKEYERDRYRKQHISNVTIEKLIVTHFGTKVQQDVRDAFPLSFETSVTHSKGLLRPDEEMCKFGKMVLEAYGVATHIYNDPMGTATIDFRSRCFDVECWEHYLQEFSDDQVLLEVNVIKRCQAILRANQEQASSLSVEEKLQEKNREQVTLKTKLVLMEAERDKVCSQDLEDVKRKLATVEEEFLALMQDCIRQKQPETNRQSEAKSGSQSLPKPDLPPLLRTSTSEFEFCGLLHPVPDSKQRADLEALLDQVAGDILELYKSSYFGQPHFRVPDLLLLQEEKRSLYDVCGTPLILHSRIPKKPFLSLLRMRQRLEAWGAEMRESSLGKKLLSERSSILQTFVEGANLNKVRRRAKIDKLRDRVREFACCSNYLEKVLGSEGLEKLKVFQTYKNALRWHHRFLDQEFGSN